jgi:hypothetical protein
MNADLERLLTDLERSHFFGTVEIGYQNGVPGHASVKRNYKFNTEENRPANRENRGANHEQPQPQR